jgi:hypothetical protein
MKKYSLLFAILLCFGCNSNSDNSSSNNESAATGTGQGGSLARFTILNDYLYTVDDYGLNVFNIVNPQESVKVNHVSIGFNIETLFNYKDYLFIGSQNGMFIYSATNPEEPQYLSDAQHFTACDPVVANNTHAFVTLHSDIGCGTTINALEIYNVEDIENPILVSSRNLTRPIGLGLYQDYLIVCDDEVKIFDVSDPENTTLVHAINKNTFDVIIKGNNLFLIGDNGLYQYNLDENDIQNTTELSSINI